MNLKKYFAVLLTTVSVITLSFSLLGCSSSDDSEPAPAAKAPKVVSTSPSNNATDVPVGSVNVQITYDQEVTLDNSKKITVSGGSVTKDATANGKVVSLFVGCYDYETVVTINIPEGLVTASGAKAEAYSLSFTTEKQPEQIEDTFEPATTAVKKMGVGWNLGNTLDANDATKTWTTTAEHETCWGQPVTKRELITMMKEAGFGAIRVPVTWYQEIDAEGKVKDAWMKRVKEVVDYVIGEGLYCILNVHHDTGADGGTFKSWIKADEANYMQNKAKFEYIWKQIAETFKDYDEHLLFEGYNEMLDATSCWNYPTSVGTYDADYAKKSLETINNYAQSFVDAVRKTGGNNVIRNLIVNTYAASAGGNWGYANTVVEQLKLPTDKVSNHLIVEVHGYPNISNGFSKEITYLDWLFNNIKENLIDRLKVPVIIGEWGTSNVDGGAGKTDYDVRKNDLFQFVDYWIKKAKELDIATYYWMGLSDGAYRSVPAFNQPDLAERIAKAYHGSSYKGKYPVASFEYVVKYNDDWSELFLYGDWSDSGFKVSDYQSITVETDKAYGDKLQIKIYGDKIDDNTYKEQYVPLSETSSTTTAVFDAATLGAKFQRITLQTMAGAQTVRVKGAKLKKADGTEVSGTISAAWGCEVTGETTISE
ncbi:MAG: cellulase family glycosylhydrolase [Prevotella sp.]|nr:cellulase family glycosylhydrolase [Prevotella sp.]